MSKETPGEAKNNVPGISMGGRALTHNRAPINFNNNPNPIHHPLWRRPQCFLGTNCTKTNNCTRKKALPAMTGSSAAAKRAYKRQVCLVGNCK
tara:strand:+ start:206 stop:484 length:279 start_codon:yes stop_codon:yes gene_type:complete